MPRQFGTIAFTPAVKAMQEKMGSRAGQPHKKVNKIRRK